MTGCDKALRMNIDLLTRLREETSNAHTALEQHALMQRMLGGVISRSDYCLYLRNLHPIYAALEQALARHALHPALLAFDLPAMFRADAIAEDLTQLGGQAWASLTVAPSAQHYARTLDALSTAQPALIGAHAYVRYLGDLSGGRIVRGRVASALGLGGEEGLAFYSFGAAGAAAGLAQRLRRALQAMPMVDVTAEDFVSEAVQGFDRHRALFDELEALNLGVHSPAAN